MLNIVNRLLAWINGFLIGVLALAAVSMCAVYLDDLKTIKKSYEAKNKDDKETSFGFKGKYEY